MYLLIKMLLLRSTVAYQVCQSYSILILFLGGSEQKKNLRGTLLSANR